MATRALVQKALTISSFLEYLPLGVTWTLIRAVLILHTSANAGSRYLYAVITDSLMGTPDYHGDVILAQTNSTTTVSSELLALGDYSQDASAATTVLHHTIWNSKMKVGQMSEIYLAAGLVTGDTWDYFIEVDEQPDE